MSQPAAILPRGPLDVARPVAAAALGATPSPLDADLRPHPRAALRRRLWWATLTTATATASLAWLAATAVIPPAAIAAGLVLWPITLGAAVIDHRALGHAISDDYLVVRSGLFNRASTALQRSAVSTIAVRESVLQRRLGLQTVTVMTSAGHGAYYAPDLHRDDATAFAADAAPGVLASFVTTSSDENRHQQHRREREQPCAGKG